MPFDRQVTRSILRCGEERAIASERLMPRDRGNVLQKCCRGKERAIAFERLMPAYIGVFRTHNTFVKNKLSRLSV